MQKKNDPSKDMQPALVPVHGLQDKKPRFLDRDSIIVGQARGCDIGLDGPDISNVHCVISRTPEGFRVRDCGSRSGTKINGTNVKTAALLDGDVLQLGFFCFKAQVPAAQPGHGMNSAQIDHLQKSRRHLAKQGLRLRRKLAKLCEVGLSRTPTELTRKAMEIKSQIHAYDERFADLEQSERELVRERDKLGKEREDLRSHVEHVELDLARRLREADDEIHKRWQEFQQRCQQEEASLANGVRAPHQTAHTPEELKEQKEELDQFSLELQEEQTRLDRVQKELDEELAMLHQQRREISTMQEQLSRPEVPVVDPDLLQTSLARVEAGLNEQRQSLARMMADMEKMQQALLARPEAVPCGPNGHSFSTDDAQPLALEAENAQLRTRIEELEKLLAATHADNKDLNDLCGDHDLLRELLKAEQNSSPNAALEKLRAENEFLAQLLQAKEEEIGSLKKEATPVKPGTLRESDLENYEAELNQYRRQLDADRAKLNIEVEQMRQRNAEMDESVRDMEMDMSRERAELARERMRLDRLREDVRIEMERIQRDGPVRESLVGVQKLREEMKQPKAPTPGNPLTDRLKNLRTKLTD